MTSPFTFKQEFDTVYLPYMAANSPQIMREIKSGNELAKRVFDRYQQLVASGFDSKLYKYYRRDVEAYRVSIGETDPLKPDQYAEPGLFVAPDQARHRIEAKWVPGRFRAVINWISMGLLGGTNLIPDDTVYISRAENEHALYVNPKTHLRLIGVTKGVTIGFGGNLIKTAEIDPGEQLNQIRAVAKKVE